MYAIWVFCHVVLSATYLFVPSTINMPYGPDMRFYKWWWDKVDLCSPFPQMWNSKMNLVLWVATLSLWHSSTARASLPLQGYICSTLPLVAMLSCLGRFYRIGGPAGKKESLQLEWLFPHWGLLLGSILRVCFCYLSTHVSLFPHIPPVFSTVLFSCHHIGQTVKLGHNRPNQWLQCLFATYIQKFIYHRWIIF
jgi:hypothetical protein